MLIVLARRDARSSITVQWEHDVTRDGQRIPIGTILDGPDAAPPPPTIVLDWH